MPARLIAYRILNDILFQKKNMDEAYMRAHEFNDLDGRDKGLCRLLVTTVLKRARQMDLLLQEYLHEPLSALKPPQIINVFRIGIAQLAMLETPKHAAVSTTVDLAEQAGITHLKPLVNAVMRRMAAEGISPLDDREAGRINTPDWLWNIWVKDYGVETALDIASANLTESPVDFSVKRDPQIWAEKLEGQLLPTGSIRKSSAGFVPGLPGFEEGDWWIQNAAAALPVQVMGELKGKTVIDLCAAPGGKTAQLAAAGAHVIALDRSAPRIARLHENMERLGFDVETVIADGAVWQPKEKVDAVLLDAPCSATGTLRHQPDALHLKDVRDQDKLAALQKRLLVNALEMLKPGGVLVYCTCSIQKDESERQAEWFLQQGLPVKAQPIGVDEIDGISEMVTKEGEIRALPFHWKVFDGIDGFFVARFVRL